MVEHWRPVAQTSPYCRLLESIVPEDTYDHLKINNIISKVQHGFIRDRSTATNQLLMLDEIITRSEKKIQTDIIFLDFSKALIEYRTLN